MAGRAKRLFIATSIGLFLALNIVAVGHADDQNTVLDQAGAERLFTLRILPLLKVKCFGCHGDDPKDVRGEFDVRSRTGLLKGGELALPQAGPANWTNGFLPAHYQGTRLRSNGSPILDLNPPTYKSRDHQRKALDQLAKLNAKHAEKHPQHKELAARMESYELAYRMQTAIPGIVDIDREPEHVRRSYGLERKETAAFGKQCLMARRLVEEGVRFVQIFSGGWDSHDYLERGHSSRIASVDQPIAALIKDLKQRGLLDETLVVWTGEFGRTPDNNYRGGVTALGRGHNVDAMNMWFAGGVKRGAIVGATDDIGAEAVEVVHPIRDVHVTTLHLLGLDDNKLTYFHGGRFKQLSQFGGELIPEIMA